MDKTKNTSAEVPLIRLGSIDEYLRYRGFETLHPLVAVVDLHQIDEGPVHVRLNYGFYALWLKRGAECTLRYGRQSYDYQRGTIVSFAPGQTIEIEDVRPVIANDSVGLLFHPDLLHGTALGQHISDYHFFGYDSVESLHISEREERLFLNALQGIRDELDIPVDKHSQTILADRIKTVLDYCQRFYERQFITRHTANSDVLASFERHLREYFQSGQASRRGLPTVAYFADKVFLSTGYFGDLIKRETGLMARQFIQQRIVDLSKQMLREDDRPISEISDYLGFQYPQHFTRFFRRQVGQSPSEYRSSQMLQ